MALPQFLPTQGAGNKNAAGMESTVVRSGDDPSLVLKWEAGAAAAVLELGQGLAGFAVKEYAMGISIAVRLLDTSGVLAPRFAGMVDALPIMSGRSGPTLAPLSCESGTLTPLEVAVGPSPDRGGSN